MSPRPEIETITFGGTLTGGSFTITLNGLTTTDITDFSAASIVSAITALDPIYGGKVGVILVGNVYTITFWDVLGDLPELTVTPTDLTQAVAPSASSVDALDATTDFVSVGFNLNGTNKYDIGMNHQPVTGGLSINLGQTSGSGGWTVGPFSLFDDAMTINAAITSITGNAYTSANSIADGFLEITDSTSSFDPPTVNTSTLKWDSVPATSQVTTIDLKDSVVGTGNFKVSIFGFSIAYGDDGPTTVQTAINNLGYGCTVTNTGNVYTITSTMTGVSANATFAVDTGSTLSKTASITVGTTQNGIMPVTPTPSFTTSHTWGYSPLTIGTTNTSTGDWSSVTWTDEETSATFGETAGRTYSTGTHTLTMTLMDAHGASAGSTYVTITVIDLPVANYSVSPTGGTDVITAEFTNTSTGVWDHQDWSDDIDTTTDVDAERIYTSGLHTMILTLYDADDNVLATHSHGLTVSDSGNSHNGSSGNGDSGQTFEDAMRARHRRDF